MLDVERSREPLWVQASVGLLGVGGVLLSVNAGLNGGHPHSPFWTNGLSLAAYGFGFLGVICFLGAMREWRMPGTTSRPVGEAPRPDVTSRPPRGRHATAATPLAQGTQSASAPVQRQPLAAATDTRPSFDPV